MRFLLLFLLPFSLFASKILSYNIYDRTNHADVMITFDTPYNGTIRQSVGKSKIIIKLENASIESPKIKKVSSKYLHSLTITPMQNQTQIVASVPSSVKIVASKTADAYGLRLRFLDKHAERSSTNAQSASQSDSFTLPTKKGDNLSNSYYIVLTILVVGIFILFYLRKKIPTQTKQTPTKQKNSWGFQADAAAPTNTPTQQQGNEVTIRFQKAIDEKNSVVMIDFGAQSYLILMGNGNILLDKFTDNIPTSQQEFESILQSRHEELENFLNGQDRSYEETPSYKEPLESYKEKAASLLYSEQQ